MCWRRLLRLQLASRQLKLPEPGAPTAMADPLERSPNGLACWQFHLHYFDWAREWLKDALGTGYWPAQSATLQPLLDSWIASNSPGRGDGWHSYTLSLRTRNWIALFRACPALATSRRLQSLWQQLCWLQAHPEHCPWRQSLARKPHSSCLLVGFSLIVPKLVACIDERCVCCSGSSANRF
jgi:hypothetical protein